MNKVNKGTGAGGKNTNKHGKKFEDKKIIYSALINSGYKLSKINKTDSKHSVLYEIYKDSKLIGYYGRQGKLYEALKLILGSKFDNTYINKILSSKINPDSFILINKKKLLTIFEKKWQQRSGSVDEKVQTGPYKLEMFEKLLRNFGFKVSYNYLLSDWFKKPKYKNLKEYYENNEQIELFIDGENLIELDINKYIKL